MASRIARFVRSFVRDEGWQDLLEYALLTMFVGLAGLAALNAMGVTIGAWYGTSNTSVNNLWNSPTPSGS